MSSSRSFASLATAISASCLTRSVTGTVSFDYLNGWQTSPSVMSWVSECLCLYYQIALRNFQWKPFVDGLFHTFLGSCTKIVEGPLLKGLKKCESHFLASVVNEASWFGFLVFVESFMDHITYTIMCLLIIPVFTGWYVIGYFLRFWLFYYVVRFVHECSQPYEAGHRYYLYVYSSNELVQADLKAVFLLRAYCKPGADPCCVKLILVHRWWSSRSYYDY